MRKIMILAVLILLAGSFSLLSAQTTTRTATVKEVSGKVEVKKMNKHWSPVVAGMVLEQGDVIRVMKNSSALLNVNGSGETATVEIKQNSQVVLVELIQDRAKGTESTFLDLSLGEVLIKAKKIHTSASKFEVKTPTSIVGVRGTVFSVAVEAAE